MDQCTYFLTKKPAVAPDTIFCIAIVNYWTSGNGCGCGCHSMIVISNESETTTLSCCGYCCDCWNDCDYGCAL